VGNVIASCLVRLVRESAVGSSVVVGDWRCDTTSVVIGARWRLLRLFRLLVSSGKEMRSWCLLASIELGWSGRLGSVGW